MPFAEIKLLALRTPSVIVPGTDAAHATSAVRYLQVCLDGAVYRDILHDVPVEEQTPDRVREWVAGFLAAHTSEPHAGVAPG